MKLVTCLCILMHTYLQFYVYIDISTTWHFFDVSFSFFLSLPLTLVTSWHLSVGLLYPGTLFVLGYLLLLILLLTPHPLTSGSVMRRPNQTSLRTFQDVAFIRNAKSFYQTSLTLTYPLLSTIEVWSHYVAPRSRALP